MTEASATSTVSRASQSSINASDEDESLGVDLDGASIRTGNRSNKSDINAENLNLRNETKKTSVIRCLVITTLLTAAAIVANVALIMTLNEEEVEFKTEYSRVSHRLIDHFLASFEERISAADSMISQLTFQGSSTPYLGSIPGFEFHAEGIRKLSTSMTISYAPIVRGQVQRKEFEGYAVLSYNEEARSSFESEYLPNDGKYNFGDNPLVTFVSTGNRGVEQGIYRVKNNSVMNDESSIFFAPIWQVRSSLFRRFFGMHKSIESFISHFASRWQVAPFNNVTSTTIMFNQMSENHRNAALQRLLESSGFVVSDILYGSATDSLHNNYSAPVLALYYPVLKDVVKDNKTVVGAITLEISLESLLENTLRGFENEPITAVIETSCDSQYSFNVRGDQVTFLGIGDLQENIPDVGTFDLMSSNYTQFDDMIKSFTEIYPTADEILCSYRIKTYPTVDFYTNHLTNRPLIVESLVGLVFLFTVAVLLAYDCLVERRQRRVLAAAQRTNALVGSLFPQGVRDRLVRINLYVEQLFST